MELARTPSNPPFGPQLTSRVGRCPFGNFKCRAALHLKSLALRHQLGVLQRSVRRPRRLFEIWTDWRLFIAKPQTEIAWHRKGFLSVVKTLPLFKISKLRRLFSDLAAPRYGMLKE